MKHILTIISMIICGISYAKNTTVQTQYKRCVKTEYQGNLYWDPKKQRYWSQEGPFQPFLNTCDKDSCHYETINKKRYKNCLARPDNTKKCRIPCYQLQVRPKKPPYSCPAGVEC